MTSNTQRLHAALDALDYDARRTVETYLVGALAASVPAAEFEACLVSALAYVREAS